MKSTYADDDVIAELIPRYLVGLQRSLSELLKAAQIGDYDTARKIAHAIKGSSACYGYEPISKAAGAIEQLCLGSKPDLVIPAQLKILTQLVEAARHPNGADAVTPLIDPSSPKMPD